MIRIIFFIKDIFLLLFHKLIKHLLKIKTIDDLIRFLLFDFIEIEKLYY